MQRSERENCKISLKAGNVDIAKVAYLIILHLDGPFVSSKALADFVCNNFAIQDFIETNIVALSVPVETCLAPVWARKYGFTLLWC